MPIFGKNPNERAYTGGKKHWADVIKNSGPGEVLIWRQPEEDFNTNSTLIVMPGEAAIFIKEGNVEQVFEREGTYRLTTQNYPFISRLRNALTGGISTFNCVVYFVRKSDSQEIKWGTDSPIQVRDHVWGVRTDAKVRGAYKVRIINPVKFLKKLIGSNVQFLRQDELQKYFASEFQGKIKSAISKFLNALKQELIGIDAYLDELSEAIQPRIDEALDEYGLKCVRFSLAGLDIDTKKYDMLDESQISLIEEQRRYQGKKMSLDILGSDWERVQDKDILHDLANNPSAGMGMGLSAAGAFGAIPPRVFPSAAGRAPQGSEGTQPAAPPRDRISRLRELKAMFDEGLIPESEYNARRAEILKEV